MPCDKYKEALIKAAATGAALPIPVREHVNTCAHCGATLAAQQGLFTLIDASLHSRTNVGVPSNFVHSVRAVLQIQASRGRRTYSSVFAFGSMVAAAALALAIFLTHNSNKGRQKMPPGSVAQIKLSASHPRAASGESKQLKPPSHQALHSHSRALNIARHLNVPALGSSGVEVLVPQGQEELLVKYVERVAALAARAAFNASLQHEANMKSMEVPSIEISELVVKPLPDLSSN